MPDTDAQRTALLVIDLQQALCDLAPTVPMADVKDRIQSLLAWPDGEGHLVVFIQHSTEAGTILERGRPTSSAGSGSRGLPAPIRTSSNSRRRRPISASACTLGRPCC